MARITKPSYSIYRRDSGRWQLLTIWYEGRDRHQRKVGTFATKAAATTAAKDWQAQATRGELASPSTLTMDAWLDLWLDLCRTAQLRPRTIYDYSMKLAKHVRPAIGALPLQDVEPVHMDAIYATMAQRGLSARTIRYLHSICRKALKDAMAKGLLVANPADRATPPRARAARAAERRIWTPEQLSIFLDALGGSSQRAILHLLAMTGLRRSEACALTWESLDLDRAVLEVRAGLVQTRNELHLARPETERGHRVVDLDPETVALLRVHRRDQLQERLLVGPGYQDHGYVFARPDGEPWKPDTISQAFGRIVDALDLPRITLHDLRHGHASYLLATATDVNTVSARLGHSTAGFTLTTYGHSLPGRQTEAVARVAALIHSERPSS